MDVITIPLKYQTQWNDFFFFFEEWGTEEKTYCFKLGSWKI